MACMAFVDRLNLSSSDTPSEIDLFIGKFVLHSDLRYTRYKPLITELILNTDHQRITNHQLLYHR